MCALCQPLCTPRAMTKNIQLIIATCVLLNASHSTVTRQMCTITQTLSRGCKKGLGTRLVFSQINLPNCRPLNVNPHLLLGLYSPSKKPVFMPVASAQIGAHRAHLVVASNVRWPEYNYVEQSLQKCQIKICQYLCSRWLRPICQI